MGGFKFMFSTFSDLRTSLTASELAGEFIRGKIRETVNDPELAQKLLPLDHPFGSKRILIDTDYFETYNRDNVELVDINAEPIVEITETGITAGDTHHDVDVIVYATGFDAMTGSFNRIDIRGRDGQRLKDKWEAGPRTYLGLTSAGFPNLFMITGPGSPSVLSNMPISIEQHVEMISGIVSHLDRHQLELIEAEVEAGRLGRTRQRGGGADHVHARQLVVSRGQHPREAEGVHALRRWRRRLPPALRQGRGQRL